MSDLYPNMFSDSSMGCLEGLVIYMLNWFEGTHQYVCIYVLWFPHDQMALVAQFHPYMRHVYYIVNNMVMVIDDFSNIKSHGIGLVLPNFSGTKGVENF